MFYLGTHQPDWLGKTSVPLFVNLRRFLYRGKKKGSTRKKQDLRKKLPRALGAWALDSGAFSEIKKHGKWTIDASTYARWVRRIFDEVGNMTWAAPQDWMCEPPMLALTKLSISEHQSRTTRSYLELRELDPGLPWVPVLQGWSKDDYLDHLDQYQAAGVDLPSLPLVGLGSVCRRQGSREFLAIVRSLVACGVTLHGFGVKTTGLACAATLLASSDSLAWSFTARRLQRPALDLCVARGGHKNCANCLPYALSWRGSLLSDLPPGWDGGVRGERIPRTPSALS